MAASVGITFVNESQNFDLEKSGKSTRRRREKWSWLYLVEEEESDRESTESSPETEIANSEIESSESENPESASSETESSESAPSSVVSSSPSSGEEYEEEGQDETIEAPTVTKSKAKPKGTVNKKPSSGPSKSKSNSAGQSAKPRTRKTKENKAAIYSLQSLTQLKNYCKKNIFKRTAKAQASLQNLISPSPLSHSCLSCLLSSLVEISSLQLSDPDVPFLLSNWRSFPRRLIALAITKRLQTDHIFSSRFVPVTTAS